MPSVRLVNLTKRYSEVVAIDSINLEFQDKEYISIIGPSGCGKTTLIKCIAGLIEPSEGEIYIGERLVNNMPIQDRGVGYVFQEIALFPHMNVYENVSYGPTVKGWNPARTRSLAEEMLNTVALRDRVKNYPNELSGGARQKTAIARALSSGSILLLLDEPLGSLDAKVRTVLRRELRRMVKDLGLTAIHITHDQEEAMAVSDRVMVMKAGKIVEVGTPLELYIRPKKLFTANFVGEANVVIGELVKSTTQESIIRVKGKILRSVGKSDLEAREVVAAIRPEFVVMGRRVKKNKAWKGRVENKIFVGSVIRYEVRMDTGELIAVKHPAITNQQFNVEDEVNLTFPPQHVILYSHPEAGLEKEISIE